MLWIILPLTPSETVSLAQESVLREDDRPVGPQGWGMRRRKGGKKKERKRKDNIAET